MCLENLVSKIAELEASVDSFFVDTMMNNFSMVDDSMFSEVRKALLEVIWKAREMMKREEIKAFQNNDLVNRVRNVDVRLNRVEQHYYGYLALA